MRKLLTKFRAAPVSSPVSYRRNFTLPSRPVKQLREVGAGCHHALHIFGDLLSSPLTNNVFNLDWDSRPVTDSRDCLVRLYDADE
eukprot:IDg2369t1